MSKLNMKLTARDEENINLLKKRYGFEQTSELIRFLLINACEEVRRDINEQYFNIMKARLESMSEDKIKQEKTVKKDDKGNVTEAEETIKSESS